MTAWSSWGLSPSVRDEIERAKARTVHPAFLPKLEPPARFADARPSEMPEGAVRACVERYLGGFWPAVGRGAAPVIIGPAGRWKTYGAWCIARWAKWMLLPTAFVECGPFFTDLDARFFSKGGLGPYRRAADAAFLVLDDFSQVKPGSRGAELMANLVSERFSRYLPTLVTGNYPFSGEADLGRLANEYRADFARRLWHGSDARSKDGFLVLA